MKRYILLLTSFMVVSVGAQVVVNTPTTENDTSNAFIDASLNASNFGDNIGRGVNFPKTDLTVFTLDASAPGRFNFPNYYDGLLVYNTANGGTTSDPNITQTDNLTPGFYYFSNPDGATNASISDGKWVKIGTDSSSAPSKFWSLDGNGGITETTFVDKAAGNYTISGGNFIGTTDDKPLVFATKNVARLIIGKDGGLSEQVGTRTAPFDFVLKVFGKARFSEGIVTQASTYPDYVFDNYFTGKSEVNPNYEFKKLNEVEAFIKENNHLPGVTKIDDLAKTESGYEIDNTQLSIQTLEKVEELYLHVIEQQKEIQALKAELAELKK